MGYPEEPEYREFKGICRKCGKEYTYHNSVRIHPGYQECWECEDAKIAETLTVQKAFGDAIQGWG